METMNGGANALSNIFVFGSGSKNATDFVSGYRAASDKIELVDGVHLTSPISSVAGLTKISLSDGTLITVSSMFSKAQVSAQGLAALS